MDSLVMSGPPSLLNFPIEIQLDILELIDLSDYGEDRRLMANLRLTCRELAIRCEPVVFRSLTVNYFRPKRIEYLSLCPRLGKHVRNLRLVLSSQPPPDQPDREGIIAAVLGHCLSLQKLTIKHKGYDINLIPLLVQALPRLTRLEAMHIRDSDPEYRPFSQVAPYYHSSVLSHCLLDATLEHHSSRLRSLSLRSPPLHASTFRRVRDTATHLREINFTRNIGVALRLVLAEPQRWACADHLQHIRLVRCEGVHAAIFSNQLAAGVFGHPRTVYLAICGYSNDEKDLPRAPKWNIPRLELLELDHFAAWEMKYLSQIHTEAVHMDRTWQSGCKQLVEALKDAAMFPGVQVLKVADTWEERHLGDLQEACLSRGIKAVELVAFNKGD